MGRLMNGAQLDEVRELLGLTPRHNLRILRTYMPARAEYEFQVVWTQSGRQMVADVSVSENELMENYSVEEFAVRIRLAMLDSLLNALDSDYVLVYAPNRKGAKK